MNKALINQFIFFTLSLRKRFTERRSNYGNKLLLEKGDCNWVKTRFKNGMSENHAMNTRVIGVSGESN